MFLDDSEMNLEVLEWLYYHEIGTTKCALFTLFWPPMASDSLDFCSLSLEMSQHHLNDFLVLLISRLDNLMVKVDFDP